MSQEQPEKGKALIIRGLVPGLTERGKIKIGEKGRMITSAKGNQFQPPQKLDYMRVTTLLRGPDGNFTTDAEIHAKHGERPKSLPVRLLYDQVELNFQCRYVCFLGKSMWCTGDGEAAWRLTGQNGQRSMVDCPCGRQLPDYPGTDKCKINGCLSVIIDGVDRVGGVWKFRTTSYNSVVGILSSLSLIKRITGGPLAGIPLNMTLNPKTAINPQDGKSTNIWVVGLEFAGSMQQLQEIGYRQALTDAKQYELIKTIEIEARRMIAHDPVRMDDEDPADIVAEFYPEQMTAGSAFPTATRPSAEPITAGTVPLVAQIPENKAADVPPQQPANQTATEPLPQPASAEPPTPPTAPERRARRHKFQVNAHEFLGKSEISTCGATPAQILQIRSAAQDPALRPIIQTAVTATGYDNLSYLREDEADALLLALQRTRIAADQQEGPSLTAAAQEVGPVAAPGAAPEQQPMQQTVPEWEVMAEQQGGVQEQTAAATPQNGLIKIQCPYDGEFREIESYCKGQCPIREADGFCPAMGEDPPGEVKI